MNQQKTFSSTLVCLGALRRARELFFDSVVEYAETWRATHDEPELTREERKILRSEGTAQIAEFFFLIEEGGINTPDSLTEFFERHNSAMTALLETCERGYTRFGLSQDRIEKSKFSKQQIEYVLHESSGGNVTLDQRSIGKILTEVMAFESCRTILFLLAKSGFIQRKDFRRAVLINSFGILENMYGDHLEFLASAISASAQRDV